MRTLILLALMGAALAVPRSQNRIVGGSPTTIQEYPYMANMQYAWFGIWWLQACGGALLNSRSVLSAAHCYVGDWPSEWRVRLGTSLASSGGNVYNVAQLVLHERYNNPVLDNDVAIVRLTTEAVYTNNIQPAFIAGPNYNLPDGTRVTAIGWGTLVQGGQAPEQLHHVDVYTINQQLCYDRYAYLKTTDPRYENWPDISAGMLCAGILDVGGKDACQGDSGGPLAHNGDVVVGVTSWGYGCAHAFYPGVNARVSYYSNWIINKA